MIYESTRKMSVKEQEVYDLGYLNGKEAALLGPQPDPITGLVPCGCGGKAIMLCDLEYAVACEKCLINLPYAFDTKELARQAWNTAMCYTAPPRPGAFGPEQDRTAPIGDKGAGE